MWLITGGCLLAAAFFLTWAIQTAWVGSFPGRDRAKYSAWALLQIATSLAFAIAPLIIWFFSRKRRSCEEIER